jgi:membrane protease YdiL (CAAX protease family)
LNEIRKILLFLIGSTLLGALLAPWLWIGAQWLAETTSWRFAREADFPQVFDRAVLVAAALLLWPTLRGLQITNLAALGIDRDPHGWRHLAIGFFSAAICMAAFATLLMKLGVYRWKAEPPYMALFKIALSAITVALLEEWLFRGAILGFFRRALLDWPAVFCTSALFSIVHFVKPPSGNFESIDWLTGFRVLPSCFAKFAEPMLLLAGFSTLFAVGWVLGWSVLRTRALWLAVGLHAGWVFTKFGFSKLTKRSIKDTLPWVGDDMIVGLGALSVVALTWLLAWLLLAYADRRERSPRW